MKLTKRDLYEIGMAVRIFGAATDKSATIKQSMSVIFKEIETYRKMFLKRRKKQ